MLAKLAWDFSAEQLDHLFKCFQDSWHHANKKQREKLLELIRRLAEDDKEGVMAQKVHLISYTRVVPRISNFLEAGSRQGSLQEFLAFGGKRQKVETLAF